LIASHLVCRWRTSGDKASAARLEDAQGPATSSAIIDNSDIRNFKVIARLLVSVVRLFCQRG
jgi:hypothetical protein